MNDFKNWTIAGLILLLTGTLLCNSQKGGINIDLGLSKDCPSDTLRTEPVIVVDTFISVIQGNPQVVFKRDTQYVVIRDKSREDSLIQVLAQAYKLNDDLLAAITIATSTVIRDTLFVYPDSLWTYSDPWINLEVDPLSKQFKALSLDQLTGIWSYNENGEVVVTLSGSSPYATYAASTFDLPKRYKRPDFRLAAFAGPAVTIDGDFTFASGISLTYGVDLKGNKRGALASLFKSINKKD